MNYFLESLEAFGGWKRKFVSSLFSILSLTSLAMGANMAAALTAKAQITPDQTLSTSENTQVTFTANEGVYNITGGAIRGDQGNLLFHSFDSFSLENGQAAFFNSGSNIETILNRVTGGTASQINGIIRAGDVDIFMINPQGILFGPEAALEIGGSFIVSTADRILLDQGVEFSASSPQAVPLLSVSQPIGLSLGASPGRIVNESRAFSDTLGDSAGLEVLPGQSILLIGNGIELPGGIIASPSGHIELVSVGAGSSVNLIAPSSNSRSNWAVNDTDDQQNLSDIRLFSGALIYGTGFGLIGAENGEANSSIRLRGRDVSIDGGGMGGGIYATNYGTTQGGDLTLSASKQLTLTNGAVMTASTFGIGNGGGVSIEVADGGVQLLGGSILRADAESTSSGNAGGLTLNAASLSLQDESVINTSTFGQGKGGTLDIHVLGTVALQGDSRLLAQSENQASGNAGTLTINAENLSVRSGSYISVDALGAGSGGRLVIDTADDGFVEVVGISPSESSSSSSNLRSFLSATTVGNRDAGEIEINTGHLLIQDLGGILTGTFGTGKGGSIVINAAESVVVRGGAGDFSSQISSSTAASGDEEPISVTGNAGLVEISTDRLEVAEGGQIFTTTSSAGQGGDLIISADEVVLSGQGGGTRSGLFARARSAGDSGRLNLTADTLRIEQGARFTVSTDNELLSETFSVEDLGTVREATITAGRLILNEGQITAESLSGDGGIITLNVQDLLLLRNNSLISATAGTADLGGEGGEITINSPTGFIVATPGGNSDIIANAFSGSGGLVDITTQSIIGLAQQFSPDNLEENLSNDISASSQLGTNGTVTINNLDPNPAQGLVELPANTTEPNSVAQRCLADSEGQNAFVVTGQGGAPPSPRDIVRNESIGLVDLGELGDLGDLGGTAADRSAQANPVRSLATPLPTPLPTETSPETPLIEANGWQRGAAGEVVLLAQVAGPPTTAPNPSCSQLSRE
jgi:filamentous hemagglutinin family protein